MDRLGVNSGYGREAKVRGESDNELSNGCQDGSLKIFQKMSSSCS